MDTLETLQGWGTRLDELANEIGIDLDESQIEVLWQYGRLMCERNEHINLTSITSPEGILTLHMLDSLSIAMDLGAAERLIDVGTGGGFPGIPLAVACPEREFMLIDGTQKKIRFVAECIEALDIRNAQAVAARAESYQGELDFDVVIARAVGPVADLVKNAGRLLAPGGRILAMKGKVPEEELKALPRGWSAEVKPLVVPGLDAERHLVTLTQRKR